MSTQVTEGTYNDILVCFSDDKVNVNCLPGATSPSTDPFDAEWVSVDQALELTKAVGDKQMCVDLQNVITAYCATKGIPYDSRIIQATRRQVALYGLCDPSTTDVTFEDVRYFDVDAYKVVQKAQVTEGINSSNDGNVEAPPEQQQQQQQQQQDKQLEQHDHRDASGLQTTEPAADAAEQINYETAGDGMQGVQEAGQSDD